MYHNEVYTDTCIIKGLVFQAEIVSGIAAKSFSYHVPRIPLTISNMAGYTEKTDYCQTPTVRPYLSMSYARTSTVFPVTRAAVNFLAF